MLADNTDDDSSGEYEGSSPWSFSMRPTADTTGLNTAKPEAGGFFDVSNWLLWLIVVICVAAVAILAGTLRVTVLVLRRGKNTYTVNKV